MVATYEIPYKDETIYGTLFIQLSGALCVKKKKAVMVFLNHNINSPELHMELMDHCIEVKIICYLVTTI